MAERDAPRVIVCDGDPLVNTAAWAAARFARERLAGDDAALAEGLALLTRERTLGLRALPSELRRSWQLVLLNRLPFGRFAYPDLVVLLRLDPAVALSRIRARGAPRQAHETQEFLAELDRAYERVCALLERRRGLPVVRLRVDELSRDETVARAVEAIREALARTLDAETDDHAAAADRIDVIATTMFPRSRSRTRRRSVGSVPSFASGRADPSASMSRAPTSRPASSRTSPPRAAAASSSLPAGPARSTPSSTASISTETSRATCGSGSCGRAPLT